jgi:hypothetical protein
VFNVLDVAENRGTFRVQFNLKLSWLDGRLKFHNLKNQSELNTLSFAQQTTVWVPELIFDNTGQRYNVVDTYLGALQC